MDWLAWKDVKISDLWVRMRGASLHDRHQKFGKREEGRWGGQPVGLTLNIECDVGRMST